MVQRELRPIVCVSSVSPFHLTYERKVYTKFCTTEGIALDLGLDALDMGLDILASYDQYTSSHINTP